MVLTHSPLTCDLRQLGTDTWFYAKRAFLALADTLAKHMIMLKDATFNEILAFLDAVDMNGKSIPTKVSELGGKREE